MVISLGRTNANFLALVTALFILCSLPTQAKDYTQAVGTIYCDGGIRGVATHIQLPQGFDPNQSVIVTAAHVIYDPQTDQLFNQCDYRPQNKRLSGIGFKTISTHSYSVNNKDKIAQAESDLVFIRLKNKAHQPKLTLAEKNSSSIVEFSLISPYAGSFKQTQCQKINHPHLTNNKLLLHNCAVQEGSSGSPIVDSTSGDIIAVHGGRFNVQTAKNGEENTEWIGQARRINWLTHSLLDNLLAN
ncbi:MAG: trypsin-like serine peptidase [Porticoccaceae bacterium]